VIEKAIALLAAELPGLAAVWLLEPDIGETSEVNGRPMLAALARPYVGRQRFADVTSRLSALVGPTYDLVELSLNSPALSRRIVLEGRRVLVTNPPQVDLFDSQCSASTRTGRYALTASTRPT
jgi:hypothetical protein